jgi:predicted esterase
MKYHRAQIQSLSVADYFYQPVEDGPVILLLHGFNERAKRILRNTSSILPEDLSILAPNAPFPLPQKVKSEAGDYYKIGFAWYFFDDIKEEFYIDYQYPVDWLKSLLQSLHLYDREIIVVGYSQGGYLAPFIAQALPACIGVIGVHCRFRDDLLQTTPPQYPLFSLHAEQDDKVDSQRSMISSQKLKDRGYNIESILIANEGHQLGANTLLEIQKAIQHLRTPPSTDA